MVKRCGLFRGVPIYKDSRIVDGRNVYIGNGQNCSTFWFRSVEDAKKFIDMYWDRMIIEPSGSVRGLIPEELCKQCKNHYPHGSKEWEKAKPDACKEYKEEMIRKALCAN